MPLCFDNDNELRRWSRLHWETRGDTTLSGFCRDCTPAFQKEMIAAQRCEYPTVQFVVVVDEDGEDELTGVRIGSDQSRKLSVG